MGMGWGGLLKEFWGPPIFRVLEEKEKSTLKYEKEQLMREMESACHNGNQEKKAFYLEKDTNCV